MAGLQQLLKDLVHIDGLIVETDRPLAPLTTMKVGGMARCFLKPVCIPALERLIEYLERRDISYKVLGNGSNLIVADQGVGVVISLSRLKKIYNCSQDALYVEAGCSIAGFLNWCVTNGYSGIEPLAGIPGSLGGALRMNASANGTSIGDFVKGLCVTTSEGSAWISVSKGFFGYRKSSLAPGGIISAAKLRIHNGRRGNGRNIRHRLVPNAMVAASAGQVMTNIKGIMRKRLSSQPLGQPSAGCVFKNPSSSCSAWSLIASCGLQGVRMKDAQVSRKHANFIVNLGRARSSDVLSLIGLVKKKVWEETGVVLKEEVIVWGNEEQRL